MVRYRLVHKFGGDIASTPEYLKKSAEIISDNSEYANITVVSALRGVTKSLAEKGNYFSGKGSEPEINSYIKELRQMHYNKINHLEERNIIEENLEKKLDKLRRHFYSIYDYEHINPLMTDKILVYGENLSSEIFRGYFLEKGLNPEIFTGREIGIITNEIHGDADINWELTESNIAKYLEPLLEKGITPIVTGFDGENPEGEITTLGRSGSDTTACVIGRDLNANEINLYKTTRGVTTADPKIVGENAKTIPFLNYHEAMEAGEIIHSKGIEYAKMGEIPIIVRYISDPEIKTVINGNKNDEKGVKLIKCEDNCYIIQVEDSKMAETEGQLGFTSTSLGDKHINLELARDGFNNLIFVADSNTTEESIKAIKKIFEEEYKKVDIIPDISIIRAIGNLGYAYRESALFNETIYIKGNEKETLGSYPSGYAWGLDGTVPSSISEDIVRKLHKKLIE